jgi:hypothetical protein
MEVSGQLNALVTFLPGERAPYSTGYEAGWAPETIWTRWRRKKSIRCPYRDSKAGRPARSLVIVVTEIRDWREIRGCKQKFPDWRLERELRMVQLSATRCSCIGILWVSLASFVAITLWRGQQRVLPKVNVYFVIGSVRKLLDTPFAWHTSVELPCRESNTGPHE